MPARSRRFRERHPGVELSLSPAEPKDGAARSSRAGEARHRADFEAHRRGRPETAGSIEHVHLLDDPLYVALAADHRSQQAQPARWPTSPASLDRSGTPTRLPGRMTPARLRARRLRARIAFKSDDYAAIQGFVAAGVGVSLIAELALHQRARRHRRCARSGAAPPLRRIAPATLAGGCCSPARAAMLEILTDVAGSYRTRRPISRCCRLSESRPRDLRLHGDVRARRAHRLDQPRPGLPRRRRPDRGRSTAAIAAMHAGANQYAPLPGVPALRAAIAEHQRARYGLEHDPDDRGAGHASARPRRSRPRCSALCEPGDEVVALDPTTTPTRPASRWPARACGGVPLRPPDVALRRRRARGRGQRSAPGSCCSTRPHNPTGRVLDRAELEVDRRGCAASTT